MSRHNRFVTCAGTSGHVLAASQRHRRPLTSKSLTVAIASVLSAVLPGLAFGGNSTITVSTGHPTNTMVVNNNNTYEITTSTVRGGTGFNSFGQFNVAQGDTVNLRLPNGTNNLVNLVWDSQALINGAVNSYKHGQSQIGGRVFFADPHGVVVGAGGVLNAGALAISTPTAGFMGSVLSDTTDAAATQLMRGQAPLADGAVSILGTINARDDVRIQAHALDVSGLIWVQGGNGADKLDSQITVNTGAGDGTRLVQDGDTILLVGADSVTVSGSLRNDGGDVIVQSNETVSVSGTINTRDIANNSDSDSNPADTTNSSGASGHITLVGESVNVTGTGVLNAYANNGYEGGDITLEARARDKVQTGQAKAESSATIDGTLRGRDITATAQSTAESGWDLDSNGDAVDPVLALGSQLLGLGAGISLGYLDAVSTATVTVGTTARVTASSDLTLEAKTIEKVDTSASNLSSGAVANKKAGIAAVYGAIDADATVQVVSGAVLSAGEALSLRARTQNDLDITASSITTGDQVLVATVAVSNIDVDSIVSVAAGATLDGGAVEISAHNQNSFSTSASAQSNPNGKVGIAGAVSLQDVNATATNAADLTSIDSLLLDSSTDTDRNLTRAAVGVAQQSVAMKMYQIVGDAKAAIADKVIGSFKSAVGIAGQQTSDPKAKDSNSPFRLGSALAFTDATHTATTTLADNTAVTATGNVTVHAGVTDGAIRNQANSAVDSDTEQKDEGGSMSKVSLSAGMTYGHYRHTASARVGKGASIDAARIAVGSETRTPVDISWTNFDSIDEVLGKLNANLGVADEVLSTYTSAESKAGTAAIGGAVNYHDVGNSSTAWVDDDAALTSHASSDPDTWTTLLGAGDTAHWTQAINVAAFNEVSAVHMVGPIGLPLPSVSSESGGAAVGGAFNNVIYRSNTVAGIGAGATVTAADGIAVRADSQDTILAFSPMAGTGASIGVNGTVSIADVDDSTHASISNDSNISARTVDVTAAQDYFLWSVSGALTSGNTASVGFAVGINNLSSDTRAFVGDNSGDDANGRTSTDTSSAVVTDDLDVDAATTGEAGAIAVAGAYTSSPEPNAKPGFIDNLKSSVNTKVDGLRAKAADKFSKLPLLDKVADKVRGAQGADVSQEKPPQPKFGLSVSGSASMNMADLGTRAYLDGVTVTGRNGGTNSTSVQAVNAAELVSASGAAAITRSKADTSKFNGAMAGAVAYSLIDNDTEAYAKDTTLSTADDIAVRALNAGEQTGIAISVGVEASDSSAPSASFTGSFSIAQSDNNTKATLQDTVITGSNDAGDSGVEVTAYDRARIGVGGGSLYVNTSTGSNANIGAAFTYAEMHDDTHATVSGGEIRNVDAVAIRAVDSALIGSAAAMGGGGAQANGLSGAGIWNEIGNTAKASVKDGAVIDVDGDIAVSARASAPVGALDALIAGGVQDQSGFDYAGTELYANTGEAAAIGTSIVSVAGLIQAGKNNIGLSFVGSQVDNTHEVEIAGAQLDAGTGRIDLDASDNTRIISAAVGVGVAKDKFAGMGTATANIITNTDKVGVTGSTLNASVIDAHARDDSRIDSIAGNVTVSKNTAAGAAVTYNSMGNTVEASSSNSHLTADTVVFDADHAAVVLAGAVAGAISQNVAISGSFSWTESHSDVTAAIVGGDVVADDLDVTADNGALLKTLSGSVAVSKQAAIGAAINVVDVSDTTTARIDDAGLAIADAVLVQATGTGDVYSLAVAGSAAQNVAVSGSNANNLINNTVQAQASDLHGANGAAAATAASLTVKASNTMAAHSLAGAVAAAQHVAVGGAIGYNEIGGRTSATLSDSVLAVTGSVDVDSHATATIETIAVAAGGAQTVAVAGSATANVITSAVEAGIANTSLDQTGNTTTVIARDASQIDSLAGSAAVAGNVGVGAAVAVNRIGNTTEAYLDGGAANRQYHAGDVTVSATGTNPNTDSSANIRTIAIGVGGGGVVGGAASVAVNLLDGEVNARIGNGANVLAENNVAVLAQNRQGIDVFAGSVGLGVTAGIGLGVVVNEIGGQTTASIEGATTQVSGLAKSAGRNVASGNLRDPDAIDVSDVDDVDDYVAPDLSVGTLSVNGVAVNAASQQHVATAGASVGVSFNPAGSFALAAISGTNVLGGTTRATIDGARINQAAGAASDQQVDVRASSHAMGANFIAGAAAGAGGAATAAIASNVFAQDTEASIHNAMTSAKKDVTVDATSSQNSLALSAGIAGAIVGGAASASINVFDARTRAFVTGGTLASNNLGVDASSVNHVNLISGSGAGGAVGVAGSFLVNVGQSDTQAYVGDSTADTALTLTGALDVNAASTSVIRGLAVSGAVGGTTGVAGMASVNVLANSTQAWLQRAQVSQGAERATTIDVSAKESLDLDTYAGALGVGISGAGVGAAANVAVLSSTVSAGIVDSRVDASGAVKVDALSQRDIDAITITAGVGGTAGIGGAASLLLIGLGDRGDSNAELDKDDDGTLSRVDSLAQGSRVDAALVGDSTISATERDRINDRSAFNLSQALGGGTDGAFASVANSTITSGSLAVTSDSQLGISHVAGGFGGGGVGIGGALAYTGVYDTTRATIDDRSVVTVSNGIEVSAESGDYNGRRSGHAEAYAGAAGLVGVGAAVAIANIDRETSARAGGTLTGGGSSTLDINAKDNSTVKAEAKGAAIGAAAVGVVVAEANKRSAVNAALTSNVTRQASVSGFNALDIDARSAGTVIGDGIGAAGGLLIAGTGVGVTARDESVVTAEIGGKATVQVGNGGTSVNAQATPQVRADALGATVGGSVGLGASVALAKADATVTATVGADTVLGGGNLDITATAGTVDANTPSAHAKAIAGTGGILLGASAAVAEATNTSDVTAETGANVRLPTGTATVKATNGTSQKAESLGVSAGLLAVGASVAKATSTTSTTARLGDYNIGGSAQAAIGAVTVHADATDRNAAYSTAGSGGLIAGNAARADTNANATVNAGIGVGTALVVQKLDLKAAHDTRYAGNADSVNAAAAGASGAAIGHAADSTVRARIGNNASVRSLDDIRVQAQNGYHSDNTGASVSAAGGGVLTGAAALVDVDLKGKTYAEVGNAAQLLTAIAPSGTRAGEIHVIANTLAETADSGSLVTGGAISVAVVDVNAAGNFSNDVVIGDSAWLNSYGYINLGTYTQATLGATALVNTWGLAAVGASDADVTITSDQNVTVGANAKLEAYRNIYLTAGRDARNLQDTRLIVNSEAQGYVRGLIAVPNAGASGHTASTADVILAEGANALSASNVTAGGYTGESRLNVDGTGHGFQVGVIPVTQHDSESGSAARGTVALNGTVVAGRNNTIKIDIDGSGYLTQSAGLPVTAGRVSNFMPRQFLDDLAGGCVGAEIDGCKALAALRNSVSGGPVGAWYLGPMFAAGGDIFLHGDSISGSGSVTAKGAPSITVNNLSNHYLVLDSIEVPDYSGGKVRFTGTSNQVGNIAVTQDSATAKPKIEIHNAWQGTAGPAIFAMEDIRNIGGLVRIRNDEGSLGQFGTVYAQQQIVEAPNGIVTFNNLGADWFSGSNPQSDWRSLMLRPGDPNDAVAYIANYLYGSGSGLLNRAPTFSGDAGESIVLWGGCLPHNNDTGCGVGPYGTVDFHQKQLPVVPARTLSRLFGYGDNSDVATNAANSSFIGQQIYVRAQYIDVNSTIDAGAGTNWSLKVNSSPLLDGWIALLDLFGATGLHDIPAAFLGTIGAGTRQITAQYDATNKRIVVDNVNASGGGYVYLDGKIVSSTPHGKIKVSSGYGDVRIDSGINLPVTVQDINVGNGAVGVIEIVDRQKAPIGTTPYTTWYVSRQGQGTQAYDNRNGATSYDSAFALGSLVTYNPQAGMRYGWSETARVGRADRHGNWSWVDQFGGGIDPGQQWSTTGAGFYQGTAGGSAFQQDITGSFSSFENDRIGYGCDGQFGSCNFGFPLPPGGAHWDETRNGGDGGWETWWMYRSPLRGTISLNASVKADNAIAIDFSGNAQGWVDVKANGNLFLDGRISNEGGTTLLTAVRTPRGGIGDIVRNSDTASITTRHLIASATGGIGRGEVVNPLSVTLTDGGTLTATAGARGAWFNLLSGAAVNIRAGDSSGYGDVDLVANGSITGFGGLDIVGRNITLHSLFGGIGSTASPLDIEARETHFGNGSTAFGAVDAHALGDISITDHSGNFWINKIVSDNGNVALDAANGTLLDARLRTAADTLTQTQIDEIRNTLKLNGSGVAGSVAAFENQVKARYHEYWRLLGLGSVSGGVFVVNAGAIVLFRPLAEAAVGRQGLTDQEVSGYVADRYTELADFFTGTFGTDWKSRSEFASHNTAFSYTVVVGSQQHTDLSRNAVWTTDQLRYAINANALEPSSGAVGTADPNVSGRDVLLSARGIGRLAADLDIAYANLTSGTLAVDEALALALANAPGDVLLIAADGHVLTRAELLQLTPADIAAGAIKFVRVRRTSPLFVAVAGKLSGDAGGSAFLQANGDLHIDRFSTVGDARVAASGSIQGTRTDGTAALVTGGDLVLLAGNGSIGTPAVGSTTAAPLILDLTGRLLSVSAGQDALLRQLNGDFRLGSVFANGDIRLESPHGSIVSFLDGVTLNGQDIDLAARDSVGHRSALTGNIDGALQVRVASSSRLSGSAGTDAWVVSPDQDLAIGSLTAGRDLTVTATQNNLRATTLNAGGMLRAAAGNDVEITTATATGDAAVTAIGDLAVNTLDAANVTLSSGGDVLAGRVRATGIASIDSTGATVVDSNGFVRGAIVDIDASSLDMRTGSRLLADSGDITVDTTGDMRLGGLSLSHNETDVDVLLNAGGRIDGNGDGQVNVSGGSANALSMLAGQGIGSTAIPLSAVIGRMSGRSTGGDIHLQLPNGGRVDSLVADAGSISLGAGGRLDLGLLQAANALRVSTTGDLDANTVIAGFDLMVDAAGHVVVHTVDAGGNAAVNSGTSTALLDVLVDGDAALAAGTTLTVSNAVIGGALDAQSSGPMMLADTQVGNDATLRSADGILLGTLTTGGDLRADAHSDLIANEIEVGGNADLLSGGAINVDTADVTGALSTRSGGSTSFATLSVGANATLTSGEDVTLNNATVGRDLSIDALRNATLAALDVGNNAALTTGGTLHIGNGRIDAALTAQSVGDTTLDIIDVGTTAVLASKANIVLGTLTAASNLTIDAHNDLTANALQVGGNADLLSGGVINVDTADVTGALSTGSDGSTSFTTLTVGADAALTSGADITLGDTTIGRDLSVDTLRDATLAALDVGHNAALTTGGTLHIGNGRMGAALSTQSGGDTALDIVDVGTTAALNSDANIALGTVTAGGDLAADARSDLTANELQVGGNADLLSGGAINVDTADVTGALSTGSDGSTSFTTLTVGADAALTSGADITLGDTTIGRDLSIDTLRNATLAALDVGHNAALTTGGTLHIGNGRMGAALSTQSGGDTTLDIVDVGTTAALNSDANIALGTVTAGGDLAADARSDLTANELQVGGNADLLSGGAIDVDTADVTGALSTGSGGSTSFATLTVGVDAALTSGADLTLGDTTIGRDLLVDALRNATLAALDVGHNAELITGGALHIGNGRIDAALTAQSVGDTILDIVDVGTTAALISGADIVLGTLATGGDLRADAHNDLIANEIEIGGNADLLSGRAISVDTANVTGALIARSGGSTVFATLTVGADAVLTAGEDVTLIDATVSRDLSIDALRNATLAALDVGNNAALTTGGTLHIGNGRTGAALSTQSGGDTALDIVDVGTTAALNSDANIALGTVTAGGDLAADARSDLTANELQGGGNADIRAGDALDIGDTRVVGALSGRAGTTLTLDNARIGGDTTLTSGQAMTLGTVDGGAALDIQAGTTLDAAALTAANAMTLGSNQVMSLGHATAGNGLTATAGTSLAAGEVISGGNIALDAIAGTLTVQDLQSTGNSTLRSSDDSDLATAAIGGALQVDSGANARIAQANVDGATTVDTRNAIHIGTLSGQGDIALRAGSGMILADVRGGSRFDATAALDINAARLYIDGDATLASTTMRVGDATVGAALDASTTAAMWIERARIDASTVLRAGGAMTLGDVGTGVDLDAVANGELNFDLLDGGRDVLLTSSADDLIGGSARAGRDLRINAAKRLRFDSLLAGDNASLVAAADVDGDVLHALNGDVTVQAGTDIVLDDIDAGRAVTLAGEAMRLGRVHAGTDLGLAAGSDMAIGTLQAGRNLTMHSRRGDVIGDVLKVGGNASATASRDVRLGTATVGGDLGVDGGRDVAFDRYDVDGAVSLRSGRDMRLGDGNSGGAQTLLIGGSLDFTRLSSESALSIDATGGGIDGDQLIAPVAILAARDAIALDMARIGQRLNMASTDIDGSVVHTGTGIFTTRLTGYRDGIAHRIDLSVEARDRWLIERLASMQAQLDTTARNVAIQDGTVGETMALNTRDANLWMNNLGATLVLADVQFMEPDRNFQLYQTGRHTLTDAYVVRFSPGYHVEVPNYVAPHDWTGLNYLGESAVRYTIRTLAADEETDRRDDAEVGAPGTDPVESSADGAVNIGAGS